MAHSFLIQALAGPMTSSSVSDLFILLSAIMTIKIYGFSLFMAGVVLYISEKDLHFLPVMNEKDE